MTHRAHVLNGLVRVLIVAGLFLSPAGFVQTRTASAQTPTPTSSPPPEATATPIPTTTPSPLTTQDPSNTPVASATPTATPTPWPTAAPVTVTLDSRGGTVATSDRRIQLNVPAGALKQLTRFSIAPRSGVVDIRRPIEFNLDALDVATGAALVTFDLPITLTVSLQGLVNRGLLQPYERLVIFYETGNPDAPWSELQQTVEISPNVLQVQLNHFSGYAAGATSNQNSSWKLAYNPPVTSLFSGAATYNYPIEVPPGRNNLQPNVVLAYNSRSVDGILSLNSQDTDAVPPGWSLDMASIARNNMHYWCDPYCAIVFPDQFSLALNGTNYNLFPATSGQDYGRYYAKDNPGIYVERRNDRGINGSTVNQTHEYWIVRTGDGTEYRFGYNSDSEQVVSQDGFFGICDDYCGALWDAQISGAASRWRFDRATDVYGNQMTVSYHTYSTDERGGAIWFAVHTEHARPINIDYNFDGATPKSRIEFANTDGTSNWVNRIYVYHTSTSTKVREYRLAWSADLLRLDSITQYDAAGAQSLPPTTFTHTDLTKDWWNTYFTPYLTRIDNGYGGATALTYLHDGRVNYCGKQAGCDPREIFYGFSYRVQEMRTYDGLTANANNPAIVRYAYGATCYDQTDDEYGLGGPIRLCRSTPYAGVKSPLIGHDVVTQTVLALDGTTVLSIDAHRFSIEDNNSPRRGRELQVQNYDPRNQLLAQTDTTYTWVNIGPNGLTTFTYASAVAETTYSTGGQSKQQRAEFFYDPAWQSGVQYGNLTKRIEYDDAGVAYRCTLWGYYPNTTKWIVNKPGFENVHSGGACDSASLVSSTWYSYDNHPGFSTPVGNYGQLTAVRRHNGNTNPLQFVDTVYTYDQWGNRLTETTYDNYGSGTAYANQNPKTTTTTYDGTYHLYPMSSTNAKGQLTQFQYYGINSVPSNGYPIGLLKKTIDPNNAETIYTYDVFGRLRKVIRPYDSDSYPTIEYQYVDAYNAGGLRGARVIEIHREVSGSSANRPLINFYDGLGRLVQARAETVDGSQQVVTNYVYDALGRIQTEYVPTFETFTWDFSRPTGWNSRPNATSQYDALGRTTRIVAPDGTANSTMYALRYTTQVDGNGHYKFNTTDAFGRLVRVEETLTTLEESFDTLNTGAWVFSCQGATAGCQSIDSGTLKNIGTGSNYNANFYRNVYNQTGGIQGQGIKVEFKVDGPDTLAHFALEASASPYRRFGVIASANKIYVQYNSDGANWVYPADLINPLETNVWYVLTLKVASSGWAYIEVWRKDDPSKRGTYLFQMPAGLSYRFHHWIYRGNAWLDNYHDLNFQITNYGYDVRDNLTQVTDALGNVTSMTYNALGQKTSMTDPDMGNWRYQYDLAGNLIVQIDAKRQATNSYYDELNRLKGKTYTAGPVNPDTYPRPADPGYTGYTVKYYYDEDGHGSGKGRRTTMIDPTGSASWTYDLRGRLTGEAKTINSVVYNTSFAYDAMNRVTSITYPSGEVVQQTYSAASQLTQVRSTTYAINYASGLQYNALGQVTQMTYGNGEALRWGYWGVGGQWDTGPADGLTSFGRLWRIRARTSLGTPLFDLRYRYDGVGNVTRLADVPRTLSGTLTVTLSDAFDTFDAGRWSRGSSANTVIVAEGGNNVLRNAGVSNWGLSSLWRNQYTLSHNTGVQVRFKVDGTNNGAIYAVVASGSPYRRFGVYAKEGRLVAQYNDGLGWREPADLLSSVQANTWYTLTLLLDDVRGFTAEVVQTNNPAVRGSYNHPMPAGLSWLFQHWVWSGYAYLDDYREFTGSGLARVPDERLEFQYDALDRLVVAQPAAFMYGQGYTETYGHNAIGNLTSKGGVAYAYNDAAHKHAVTHLGGVQKYWYDANGSMTTRIEGSATYNQAWDAENRLATVTGSGLDATYVYDGDGNRVKKIQGGQTTVYIGTLYEKNISTGVATVYYLANGTRVALRVGSTLYYLHADQLGSTSLTTDASGNPAGELKYYPFGGTRYTWGSTPTDRRFTGQREESSLGSLYDYGARFYSALGRFISADTLVLEPGNPQSLNRYSYVLNNPVKYTDPSGHMETDGCDIEGCTLPIGYDGDSTWQKPDGTLLPYDPILQEKYDPLLRMVKGIGNTVNAVRQFVDNMSYSGIGGQVSGCGGGDVGFGLEGCGSIQILINLRSGQVGIFVSGSLAAKVGTPNGGSLSGSAGPVIAPGVSDLKQLWGPAEVQGGDVNLDAFYEAGLYGQRSASLQPYDSDGDGVSDTFRPIIDRVTGMPVTTLSAGPQVGLNQIPTVVDGTIKVGGSRTVGCVFTALVGVDCR